MDFKFPDNIRSLIGHTRHSTQGIDATKNKGKHLGRPKIAKPDNWDEVYAKWVSQKITAREAMSQLGISKNLFYMWALHCK